MCSSTIQLPLLRCSIAKTVLAGTLTSITQGCDRDPKRPVPTMWPACEDRQRRVKARLLRQSRAHCDAEGRERRAATQVRVASDRGHEDVGRGTWDVGWGTGDGTREARVSLGNATLSPGMHPAWTPLHGMLQGSGDAWGQCGVLDAVPGKSTSEHVDGRRRGRIRVHFRFRVDESAEIPHQ